MVFNSSIIHKGNDLSKLTLAYIMLLSILFHVLFFVKHTVHIVKSNDLVRVYISDLLFYVNELNFAFVLTPD